MYLPIAASSPSSLFRRSTLSVLLVLAGLTTASCDDGSPTHTDTSGDDDPVLEVVLSGAPASLLPGETAVLDAQVRRASGPDAEASVVWTSSDPGVVAVAADGTVTGGVPGGAVIRAAAGGTFSEVALYVVTSRASDDAVVVEPTAAHMVASDEERAAGVLKFVPGTGSVPALAPGSVVVGGSEGGYLARVVETAQRGDTLVVATEPAALNEIVETGEFSVRFPFDGPVQAPPAGDVAAVGWGPTLTEYRARGVRELASTPGEVTLDDLDLCDLFDQGDDEGEEDDDRPGTVACPEYLEVALKNGRINYSPTVSFEASFDGFDLDEVEAEATGSLAFDIDLEATATREFEFTSERELLRRSKTFFAVVAGIPVTGVARISLHAGVKAEAEVSASAKTGFTSFSSVRLGVEYDKDDVTQTDDGWDPTSTLSSNFTQRDTHWGGTGEGKIRVWIRPELEILLYTVVGPSASMTPWIEGSGQIELDGTNPENSTCTYDVKAAVDTQLKARVTFLDKNLAEWKHDDPGSVRTLVDEQCAFGSVTVQTATSGEELDSDGYRVWLDVERKDIGANAAASFAIVPTGTHDVLLTGLAENCIVLGDNPRSIRVAPFEEAILGFPVHCTRTTGEVLVDVTTTGTGARPQSYTVKVNSGALSKPIAVNGNVGFSELAAGTHVIQLDGVPSNCTVDEGPVRTVSLLSGQTEPVDFEVECTGAGLRVSVVTTGKELDSDGYEVQVDDGAPKPVQAFGSVEFPDVLPGTRVVRFTGLADNCQLVQDNPSPVTVSGLSLTRAEFEVRCIEGRVADEDIVVTTQAEADALDFLSIINGNLTVGDGSQTDDPITDVSKLRRLIRVDGTITIRGTDLPNLNDFENLTSAGRLYLMDNDHLTDLSGLAKLRTLGTRLLIFDNAMLSSLNGLSGVTTTGRGGEEISVFIGGENALSSLAGLGFLTTVAQLSIRDNSRLTSLQGLTSLKEIKGGLTIQGTDGLTSLAGLEAVAAVGGRVYIYDNEALTTTSGLSGLKTIGRDLIIERNAQLQQVVGITGLERVEQNTSIRENEALLTVSGLGNAATVYGSTIRVSDNDQLLDVIGLRGAEVEGSGQVIVFRNARLDEANFSIATVGGRIEVNGNARLRTLGFQVSRVGDRIEIDGNGEVSPMENLQGLSGISVGDDVRVLNNHISSLSGLNGLSFDNPDVDWVEIRFNTGVCNQTAESAASDSGATNWLVDGNTGENCGG